MFIAQYSKELAEWQQDIMSVTARKCSILAPDGNKIMNEGFLLAFENYAGDGA